MISQHACPGFLRAHRLKIGDEQVRKGIVVIVAPNASPGASRARADSRRGVQDQPAVARVRVKHARRAVAEGNKQIEPSVVVEVTPGAT